MHVQPPALILIVLACLAAYALAYSGAHLDGPFGLFSAVRSRFDPDQATWIGRGLNCPMCQGFWWSAVVVALLLLGAWPVVVWLGVWGVVIIATKVLQ